MLKVFRLVLSVLVFEGSSNAFRRPVCVKLETSTCLAYNPDPHPNPFPVLDQLGDLVVAEGYPPPPPQPPLLPGEDDPHFDIVARSIHIPKKDEAMFHIPSRKLERYFPNADIGRLKSDYEGTDLEVIEWPGIVSDKDDVDGIPVLSYQGNLETKFNEKFVPLSFEGDNSIFESYICNRRLGTHIRIMAFRPRNPGDQRFDEYNPFYVAFGPRSFHRAFLQPLYAPISQLNRLAEGHNDPECQPIEGELDPDSKLNHVLSFTFSTNRLLMGTHCGIIILKPIDAPTTFIEAARRHPDPDEYDEKYSIVGTYGKFVKQKMVTHQKFIGRITRITSNVCCAGLCLDIQSIAVAYNYEITHTEENLKRIYISFDDGESWDQKMMAPSEATFLKLVGSLFNRLNLTVPEFVSRRTINLKAKELWGDDTDNVVRAILGEAEEMEAPLNPKNETICAEIVSIQAVPEEKGFLALCRTDLGNAYVKKHPQEVNLNINYAVFEFPVSQFSPLIHGKMKSLRRLACTVKDTDLDLNVKIPREPQIILGRRSMNLIVVGCDTILYHSINGGYTFWNAVFYVSAQDGTYQRRYQLPGFDFPLVAVDPDGVSMTFTFGDYYAVAIFSYTVELRIFVGRVAETTGTTDYKGICENSEVPCATCKNIALVPPKCENVKKECLTGSTADDCEAFAESVINFSTDRKFIPYYTNSGEIKFSISVMHILLDNDIPNTEIYDNRKAVRLIDIPFQLTDAIRPFFVENTMVIDKQKGFEKCVTFGFRIDKREMSLDLGQKGRIGVSVEDNSAVILLGIFASIPNMLKINITQNDNSSSGMLGKTRRHAWTVDVESLAVNKDDLALYEDTFFGSNYDLFSFKSSNLLLTNTPKRRCQTQPQGSVLVNLGCSGKTLVAHEDYNRPQCKKFFGVWDPSYNVYNTYTFTLEHGHYDPEMLAYWRMKDPKLFKRVGDNWVVEYDYGTFGCPIQPFRLEPFEPDLRIMDRTENRNLSDTADGSPFLGQYILIEVFGQTGFTFSKTVKEAGCKRAPLNFKNMLREWKDRLKVIFESFKHYRSFHPDEVAKPENIWQKSMHYPCSESEVRVPEEVDELKIPEDDAYEVMQRGSNNSIIWNRKTRKDLYFFLAIDIDHDFDSFCDYKTYFAVSLNSDARSPPLHSVLRFFLVFIFLLILVILGYYFYRTYAQSSFRENALLAKLERGAWEILLRYEKYLHEVEIHGNERIQIVNNKPTLVIPASKVQKSTKKGRQQTEKTQSARKVEQSFTRQFTNKYK